MTFEVYVITNTVNGKQYVGITTQGTDTRFYHHKWEARKTRSPQRGQALHRALRKYGEHKFTVETVHVARSIEELNALEQVYIGRFNTMTPNGYNLTTGGRFFRMSDEVVRRASERLKGVPLSAKNVAGLKKAWGNAEIRQRRCEAIKAAMNRPDVREKTGARQRGKAKSDSHKAALRAVKARPITCLTTGQTFEAIADAVQWLRGNNGLITANHAKIVRACKSDRYSAYGFKWAYAA